ncbi:MAG: LptF/LptG family permease [Bacteroidota bacterium]
MTILDRYILSRFLYNFFSSFFILIVIFIFQGIWLFIDDLAGKGLGIVIIGKFIFYFIPTLIDKVLPLTVLLSSILTFGTFAENYEFAAMKASGISLQRGMRSLIVYVSFLGLVTFFFANNVIPKSEQKMFNLRRNIAKVKPAAAITEGVFSDFEGTGEGMNIKVDKKFGEQDRFLDNVIIHKKTKQGVNNTVIKAKEGELISSETSDIIQLVLKDGHYYEELKPKKNKEKRKHPFAKSKFETYTINIDISELNNQDLEEDGNITTNKMKNVTRLIKDIDSLRDDNLKKVDAFSKNITRRMGAFPVLARDSVKKSPISVTQIKDTLLQKEIQKDTVQIAASSPEEIIEALPDWQQIQILNNAHTSVNGILTTVEAKKEELQKRFKFYNSHILSLHQKYALAFSCIILFFVGAPLGAIIRKGGLGLPMVIAIILFLTYYFIGVFAGNYAKEGNIHPSIGAWLSTLIMLPLGIVLTKRATTDRSLVGIGGLIDFFKNLFKKKESEKVKEEEPKESFDFVLDTNSTEYKKLTEHDTQKLMDIVQRYEQYDFSKQVRNSAIKILGEKGISLEELMLSGKLRNSKYEEGKELLKQFETDSKWAFFLFLFSIVMIPVIYLVVRGFDTKEKVSEIVLLISRGLVLVFMIKSGLSYTHLYRIVRNSIKIVPWMIYVFGALFYPVFLMFYKKGILEELKTIR